MNNAGKAWNTNKQNITILHPSQPQVSIMLIIIRINNYYCTSTECFLWDTRFRPLCNIFFGFKKKLQVAFEPGLHRCSLGEEGAVLNLETRTWEMKLQDGVTERLSGEERRARGVSQESGEYSASSSTFHHSRLPYTGPRFLVHIICMGIWAHCLGDVKNETRSIFQGLYLFLSPFIPPPLASLGPGRIKWPPIDKHNTES